MLRLAREAADDEDRHLDQHGQAGVVTGFPVVSSFGCETGIAWANVKPLSDKKAGNGSGWTYGDACVTHGPSLDLNSLRPARLVPFPKLAVPSAPSAPPLPSDLRGVQLPLGLWAEWRSCQLLRSDHFAKPRFCNNLLNAAKDFSKCHLRFV